MEANYVKDYVVPTLEKIKHSHFPHHHPDEPVILHATDMKGKCNGFACLKDPEACNAFNIALFSFIQSLESVIICITVDKPIFAQQQAKYGQNPYTTCLLNLLERYYMFLQSKNGRGDVMIESGDKSRDQTVKQMYIDIYANTTGLIRCFSDRFTSKEIKIKPKVLNIAGLQIADIVGLPIRKHVLLKRDVKVSISTFEHNFYRIIDPKIRRSLSGHAEGYGIKWLP